MSLAEAMLAGAVPVVTAAGALPEVVGDTGIVIPDQSARSLATAIAEALRTAAGSTCRRARAGANPVHVRKATGRHPARARPGALPASAPDRRIFRSMSRLNHPAYRHRALQFLADAVLAAAAFALAFFLRFLDASEIPGRYVDMLVTSVAFVALGKAIIFTILGLHAKWWRYFLTRDFPALLRATALAKRRARRRLHGRLAVRRQPAPLGRRLRLHPHHGLPRRRAHRHPALDRAARRRRSASGSPAAR